MANFNVTLQPVDRKITVGKPQQSFDIKVDATDKTKQVRVTVVVGCGATGAALLASQYVKPKKVTCAAGGKTTNMDLVTSSGKKDKKEWRNSGTDGISLPVVVSLEDFESDTPPGDAEITVRVETSEGRNKWSKAEEYPIKVKKELDSPADVYLSYFTVTPDFILNAGQTEVTVSFLATSPETSGYKAATLYRNNQQVKSFEKNKVADKPEVVWAISGGFPDSPSITSVYRLRLTKPDPKDSKRDLFEDFSKTVQVISHGWNQIALPQGTPIHLFVANDFKGSGSDRLYGIFRDEKGSYALYSSATGVDDWRLDDDIVPPVVKGTFPQDMGTSPGVYYNNKLWLIGGGSVGTNLGSASHVWCYEETNAPLRKREWVQKTNFPSEMTGRVGHACVVFPRKTGTKVEEEVWVIGGYNNRDINAADKALRDVWQLKEVGKAPQETLQWKRLYSGDKSLWAARLNPAAVVYKKDKDEDECEVWLYGGSKKPQSPGLGDFWSTSGEITRSGNPQRDEITWTDMSKDDPPVPIMPPPGEPLGAAFVTSPRDDSSGPVQSDRLFLMGSFRETKLDGAKLDGVNGNRISSFLFEWHGGTSSWEVHPVFDGWQQYRGQTFYLQAIAFNHFLFCWSLQDDPRFKGKLNILVGLTLTM